MYSVSHQGSELELFSWYLGHVVVVIVSLVLVIVVVIVIVVSG